MSRIQLACYSLLASAFLLAGMLVVQLGDRMAPTFDTPAHAAMVVKQDSFSMMTASTQEREEALFLMDDNSGQLLIYKSDVAGGSLELAEVVPIRQIFQGDVGAQRGGGGR